MRRLTRLSLFGATAIAALSAFGASAQNSPRIPAQSVPQGTPQSGSAPPAGSTQPSQNAHGSPSAATTQSIAAPTYVSRQNPDQFLGVSIVQQPVYMADGRGIGEIDDLLIDRDGRIAAVVIDVGGFLGTTGRRIAVPMNALDFQKPTTAGAEPTSIKVVFGADRAQIEKAPPFESAVGRTQRSR